MLQCRADVCNGNRSKALRSLILDSADAGMRLRRAIRQDLNAVNRALAALRLSARTPGAGALLEEIGQAIGRIEVAVALRVTTS